MGARVCAPTKTPAPELVGGIEPPTNSPTPIPSLEREGLCRQCARMDIHPLIRHAPDPEHPGWWTWDLPEDGRYYGTVGKLLVRADAPGRATLRMFPGTVMSKTTIGTRFSRQSWIAVWSMNCRLRWIASS